MYDIIYRHCAIIFQKAADLLACKNRNIKMPQKRAMQTISQYANRLDYAVQSLESVPTASMQSYIQRQLLDALIPILGSAELLADTHQTGLNTCQLLHLEQILSNCTDLMALLSSADDAAS